LVRRSGGRSPLFDSLLEDVEGLLSAEQVLAIARDAAEQRLVEVDVARISEVL
jgi:hypothetical protein